MRAGWREGVEKRWRRKQRAREAPIVEAAGRARAKRTSNMDCMVVTLEVSQFDMSALNWFKVEKISLMLVIAETPQLEMGP